MRSLPWRNINVWHFVPMKEIVQQSTFGLLMAHAHCSPRCHHARPSTQWLIGCMCPWFPVDTNHPGIPGHPGMDLGTGSHQRPHASWASRMWPGWTWEVCWYPDGELTSPVPAPSLLLIHWITSWETVLWGSTFPGRQLRLLGLSGNGSTLVTLCPQKPSLGDKDRIWSPCSLPDTRRSQWPQSATTTHEEERDILGLNLWIQIGWEFWPTVASFKCTRDGCFNP